MRKGIDDSHCTEDRDDKTFIGTVDLTPTWGGVVYHMMEVLTNAKSPEALEAVQAEFRNMAMAADKWNEHVKSRGINHVNLEKTT